MEAEDFSGDYYEYKPASIFHWSSRVPEFYKSCQPLFILHRRSITQQIRALESHLGVQLFDRNTRPVRLTPEGSVFLREAKSYPGTCGTGGTPGPGSLCGTGRQSESGLYQGV